MSSRIFITGIAFLAYVLGGLIAPVAHQHYDETCSHTAGVCTHHTGCQSHREASQQGRCPFGHTGKSRTSSDQSSPEVPVPTFPHEHCAACQLLYMATVVAEIVTFTRCEALVIQISPEIASPALAWDSTSPPQRGPPTVCS